MLSRRLVLSLAVPALLSAQFGGPGGNNTPLGTPVKPTGLSRYVRDEGALTALGKALFWDAQLSSDGRFACASCHFHAGADHRAQNQLVNPHAPFQPNRVLTLDDFPFRQVSTPASGGAVLRDSAAIAGSAGLFRRVFIDTARGVAEEEGFDAADSVFSIDGVNLRQVTGRNTPSAINAVFYHRGFWDGRASDIFTGATPFGESDKRENALVVRSGALTPEAVRLDNSSLASQAVGPMLNSVEMSYEGRTWPKVGKKMLGATPLARQRVAADDSVLGSYANANGTGLRAGITYLAMVQEAFQPEYWSSGQPVDGAGKPSSSGEFTQAEWNFPLFFGLAIQAYESTLVSGDTPFDRFARGQQDAMSTEQQRGLTLFRTRGCSGCHSGPEFSSASASSVSRGGVIRRGRNTVNGDTGFFRIGVRPAADDTGLGGRDAFDQPLSRAVAQTPSVQALVEGAFKTQILRNVEFTGPYFHNGGQATLEQVVEFYSRGGDFPQAAGGNGIRRLNMPAEDRAALVAFLKALSDDRVKYERAPFDHPELCVPNGHPESRPATPMLDPAGGRFASSAADRWALLPAVGRGGSPVPLQTFEELLQGIGADGSRAHHMSQACTQD